MYTATAKNNMLNAIGVTHLSLHDGYPGTNGANELSGGTPAYARKAVSYSAASAGVRSASTQPTFDVPGGKTVRFIGFWDAITAGNFLGCVANGGQEKEFTVDATANKILSNGHGFSNGQTVAMLGTTAPTGLAIGTLYYVINATADDCQLATTSGGAAIDFSGSNSYDCTISRVVEEGFGAQGQHQIQSLQHSLNG